MTVANRYVDRVELEAGRWANPPVPGAVRPRVRSECVDGPRPCPFVGCRHHLYLEVNAETGSIKFNFPTQTPWELESSCSLDVADRGEHTLEQVGEFTNVTRERARQLETRGLINLISFARRNA